MLMGGPTQPTLTKEPEDAEKGPGEPEAEEGATSRRRRSKNRRPTLSDTVSAIPVAAFHRLAREVTQDFKSDTRWESRALEALQVDAEAYMIELFDRGNKRRRLGKSKTLEPKHFSQPVEA
jgi:histone H3/H4